MLKGFTPGKIYLATGFTDLRRGIDGLAGIIQEQFQLDAFNDTLFLFCGRRNDRIKGLYWDTNGFLLLYKRLMRAEVFAGREPRRRPCRLQHNSMNGYARDLKSSHETGR